MDAFDLAAIGLIGNLAVFLLAAIVVWIGGVRLARCADALADKADLGHVFIGTLLLGALVSLPETAFAAVAAARGNAELAVGGLLGRIGITMVAVAVTHFVVGREPLSLDVRRPVVMFQGVMVVLILYAAAAGITAGDIPLPGIGIAGVWTFALVGIYAFTIVAVERIDVKRHLRVTPPLLKLQCFTVPIGVETPCRLTAQAQDIMGGNDFNDEHVLFA